MGTSDGIQLCSPPRTKLSNTQRRSQHQVCHKRNTAEHSSVPCHNPLLSDGVTHIPRAGIVHPPAEETSRRPPLPSLCLLPAGLGTATSRPWDRGCWRLPALPATSSAAAGQKKRETADKNNGRGLKARKTSGPTSSSSTLGRS